MFASCQEFSCSSFHFAMAFAVALDFMQIGVKVARSKRTTLKTCKIDCFSVREQVSFSLYARFLCHFGTHADEKTGELLAGEHSRGRNARKLASSNANCCSDSLLACLSICLEGERSAQKRASARSDSLEGERNSVRRSLVWPNFAPPVCLLESPLGSICHFERHQVTSNSWSETRKRRQARR